MKVKATFGDINDGTLGGCIACGHTQGGFEPDARRCECEACGERKVYGLEELLIMDMLDMGGDDDE